jgi:hypothetical protein
MAKAELFWSYAHKDDENDGGRILKLQEDLCQEYELLTGEKIKLFVDSKSHKWGDDWREEIEKVLAKTTFFVPVITPTYFQREECRKELIRFSMELKKEVWKNYYYQSIIQMLMN